MQQSVIAFHGPSRTLSTGRLKVIDFCSSQKYCEFKAEKKQLFSTLLSLNTFTQCEPVQIFG